MGIFGQKGPFWIIFCQKVAIFEFSVKKRKLYLFTHFSSFFNTKNQKILMGGFSGKWAWTDERTEVNPRVNRLGRETKNTYIWTQIKYTQKNTVLLHVVEAKICPAVKQLLSNCRGSNRNFRKILFKVSSMFQGNIPPENFGCGAFL